VFENLGGLEIIGLILVALFIIGPDRLPKAISDTMGFLRKIRSMARNATSDLSRELGTNIELEDLHPKTFLRKHLLSEAEEEALRKPFQDTYREVRSTADSINFEKGNGTKRGVASGAGSGEAGSGGGSAGAGLTGDEARAVSGASGGVDMDKGRPKPGFGYEDAT
jgi:sec-independent protein translocase protein TatB